MHRKKKNKGVEVNEKLVNTAFIYAIVAMLCGIIYREGSRFLELTEPNTWSFTHTHFFVLGMFFFLIVLILEKEFSLTKDKKFKAFYIIYNIGLIITGIMLWMRGIADITESFYNSYDKMISGISGIGHILLGIGIILFFIILNNKIKEKNKTA